MESPLGQTLANDSLCHYRKESLDKCPNEFKPKIYKTCVDSISLGIMSKNLLII